jgi:hypothetical protein
VITFISQKINLEEADEKADQQLLKWMQDLNNTLEDLQSYNDLLIHFNDNLYDRLGVECCKIVAITLSNCVIKIIFK